MKGNNNPNLIVPRISDVSLVSSNEFDCIMEFNGLKYACWGFFKFASSFEPKLTHLSMNKFGARGINHVSKIETFSPLIVRQVEEAISQNVTPSFVEQFKEEFSRE